MKKIILLVISLISLLGITFVACNNDNDDYVDENVTNQELNKFFYSTEYKDFSSSFGVSVKDFKLEEIVTDHYKNKKITTFCIPINKKGKEIGQILVFSKNNGGVYKVLYEDRTNFTTSNGGKIKITTAKNKYIASIDCTKIDSKRMSMRIGDVASTITIKTRVEMPSPEDGWWTCTTECYKVAKESCGSEAQCNFLCDLIDLTGGCTVTISAACAIYCI